MKAGKPKTGGAFPTEERTSATSAGTSRAANVSLTKVTIVRFLIKGIEYYGREIKKF